MLTSATRVPGRTWTVRLTGHADHTASVTCSTEACRMPPRSRDTAALKRFAAEHAKAHARLATPRPHAACACGARQCSLHDDRVHCSGTTLLVLVHNAAVGQVWTLAEVCQACAPMIPHMSVVGRAPAGPAAAPPAGTAMVPAPATGRPAPAAVPGGFSSPAATGDDPQVRRRPRRPVRPRRSS
ncbi:hypothetical protein [Streptomyces sp. NPDC089799]|uniref:hypothetical protein n=1 Tax=Streptomyces sp. NPDC089799 TaxID=3155066 RepID=UPI0034144BA5